MARIPASVSISLLMSCAVVAAATNDPADAKIQGCNLARQLLEQRPPENFVQTGRLKMRDGKGKRFEIPVKCEVTVTATNWESVYEVHQGKTTEKLRVTHIDNRPNQYSHAFFFGARCEKQHTTSGDGTMIPFADSDFWLADLGLEFFHWPAQKVLKHEMRRGRPCKVLESTNPEPTTNGYSRVVSWIDNETSGIVRAEAYDANNKLFKEFEPKGFKKIKGRWELREMRIRNLRTGSQTVMEFDLSAER